MRLAYVVPAVIFASQAAAYGSILSRQLVGLPIESVPEQCQSTCTPTLQAVETCQTDDAVATAQCGCEIFLSGGLESCADCMVDFIEESAPSMATDVRAQLDQALDMLKEGCSAIGSPSDGGSSSTRSTPSQTADGDEPSTTASRPGQQTVRPPSPSASADDNNSNGDPLGQGNGASSMTLNLGAVAAAAGAVFFL